MLQMFVQCNINVIVNTNKKIKQPTLVLNIISRVSFAHSLNITQAHIHTNTYTIDLMNLNDLF